MHHDAPLVRCAHGATDRGELWLELVELDTPDDYVAHEVAVPVSWESGDWRVEWDGARWHCAGRPPVGAPMAAAITEARSAGVVPDDDQLLAGWLAEGGAEALRQRMADFAV